MEDLDTKYMYYDKDLQVLDKTITQAFNVLKSIKSRNELSEHVQISKSIFDKRVIDKYKVNHPDYLFRLQFGDIIMTATSDGNGQYGVNLIGFNEVLLGFIPVNGDAGFQCSVESVKDFSELSELFERCVKKFFNKEYRQLELF